MRFRNLIFIVLVSFLSAACHKSNVTIEGDNHFFFDDENDDYSGTKISLYRMTNYNPTMSDLMRKNAFKEVDSQKTKKDGKYKFEFYVDSNEPEIYFVGEGRPEGLFMSGGYDYTMQMVVAEPGNIKVKVLGYGVEVTGTPINEKLSAFYYKDHQEPIRNYRDSIITIKKIEYGDKKYKEYIDTDGNTRFISLEDEVRQLEHQFEEEQKEKDTALIYPFLKEYATKNFILFFHHTAKHHLAEEQLHKLHSIEGNKLQLDKEFEFMQ